MEILDHELMSFCDYKQASNPANNKRLKKPFITTVENPLQIEKD